MTGKVDRLNRGTSLSTSTSGGQSEGLISSMIEDGIEVKNSLNKLAISCGSLTNWLFDKIFAIEEDFSDEFPGFF